VWWFEKLMWVSLLLGGVIAVLDWDRLLHKAAADAYRYGDRVGIQAASFTMTVIAICTALVMLLLVWLIARRRMNWARWVLAAMFVLGSPSAFIGLPAMLSANPAAGALSLVQLATQIAALALVFSPNARPWFARPAVGTQTT
jgi:hypothetical protein